MGAMRRGAFVVIEGCDKAGKSTQVKMLVEALNKNYGLPAESRQFPNRKTLTGILINQYLQQKLHLPLQTAHGLFSANRWECKDDIIRTLESGKTVVVDRYAASGAAYGAVNTGRDLDWCKQIDKGLPAPDMVIFLKVDQELQELRSGWGEERFENTQFQQQVASNFLELADETWTVIDNREMHVTHTRIKEIGEPRFTILQFTARLLSDKSTVVEKFAINRGGEIRITVFVTDRAVSHYLKVRRNIHGCEKDRTSMALTAE